jgi:hypothetical protein
MRTLGIGCLLLAFAACGTEPAVRAPSSQSSHVYRGQQPAYGGGDPGGWSDPAAIGTATQGPAQPGVTSPQPPSTTPP